MFFVRDIYCVATRAYPETETDWIIGELNIWPGRRARLYKNDKMSFEIINCQGGRLLRCDFIDHRLTAVCFALNRLESATLIIFVS